MATYTSHYNLKKPATSDKIRIADFNGNADTIDATMYENATLGAQLKSDIGIVENTNTATHNISAGQYVIWKGSLYTASSAISSGATLSDANLTAVPGGGLNALNSKIANTGAWYELMGSKNADGDYSLSDSYGNYKSIVVMLFGSSNSISSGVFPTTMLITAGYKPTISSGSDKVTVTFTSTTTVTVSNLTGSVRIYGLK